MILEIIVLILIIMEIIFLSNDDSVVVGYVFIGDAGAVAKLSFHC